MAFPKNITKEHLLKAIKKIDADGFPNDADSQYYDVIYNGRKYPPKVIVSYANIFANGTELDRNSFSGGLGTQCFKLLEKNSFNIVPKENTNKMSYYPELNKFLVQAETNELGTSDFLNSYGGLSVKVSFGIGNQAKVPWIAFLNDIDTVQNGIYPVYLYYKEKKLLILAYGLSETHESNRKWNLNGEKTIEQYFKENGLGKPHRYGESYVYNAYGINDGLDEDKINSDLNGLIAIYKSTAPPYNKEPNVIDVPHVPNKKQRVQENFNYRHFNTSASNSGLYFNDKIGLRFAASLLAKPFVILTGLSGSGKTKLAQAFVKWICKSSRQYCIVPVGSDWTNREPLLGFPNTLKEREYVKPDNGVLDLLIKASNDSENPYFLILDEMNLSHVERYFADFLSVMESKSKISLHSGTGAWNEVPPEIDCPENLFIIGTVNIDETTYMFSPKVLDRANVIEFRVTKQEMEGFLNSNTSANLRNLESAGESMAESFVKIAKNGERSVNSKEELNIVLLDFFAELKKVGTEFGYRTATEIVRYVAIVNKIEPSWEISEIIDTAIIQKMLPKVHGSRRKLEPVLKALGTMCLQEGVKFEDLLNPSTVITYSDSNRIKYPISLEKILRMLNNLISNGFTSYAEA